jgi:hypothetical protein
MSAAEETSSAHGAGKQEEKEHGLNKVTVELVIAEYNTLRDEILRRSDRQVQTVTLTIIALGTLLAAGIQFKSAPLIFIYPLLAAALAAIWAAEDRGIQATGAYIWRIIEEQRAGIQYMTWEHFAADNKRIFRTNHRNAIRLFFLGSAIAVIILGVSIPQPSNILTAFAAGDYLPQAISSDDVLLMIAVISAALTCIILFTLTSGSPDWRAKMTKSFEKQDRME